MILVKTIGEQKIKNSGQECSYEDYNNINNVYDKCKDK